MAWFVRVYDTQKKARDAAKKLMAAGYPDDFLFVMTPTARKKVKVEADTDKVDEQLETDTRSPVREEVAAAILGKRLPPTHATIATEALEAGRSVVAIDVAIGQGTKASNILDSFEPVTVDQELDEVGEPRLISEKLGIPLLWNGESSMSRVFGGLLANSNLFIFGPPRLKDDPAPLSSKIGMKVLSKPKKPWTHSFGLPLLSSDPTPLSSRMGWRVLKK